LVAVIKLLLALLFLAATPAQSWMEQGSIRGPVALQTWKELRDQNVAKQRLDYSCGAASLATLLRLSHGIQTNEAQVLSQLRTSDMAASFRELAEVARNHYQLPAQGYALSMEMLQEVRRPLLLYLEIGSNEHFSVLRGIDREGQVWLADPSWGNRFLTAHQFREMWSTRDDPLYIGKVLMIGTHDEAGRGYFFTEDLSRQIRRSTCRNCGSGLL
jgi:uncharacterized protein